MKIEDYAPKRIIDNSAKTIAELRPLWGVKENQMSKIAREYVAAGEWELVWKRTKTKGLIRAYRARKKK